MKILDKIERKLEQIANGIDTHPRTTFTFLGLLVLISFIFFVWAIGRI